MNLKKKKQLAARTLGVGTGKIAFARVDEIKEAITKQDIRDLASSGAIIIKQNKGKRKLEKRKIRSFGKIKKKIRNRKQNYVKLTRKLREYARQLKLQKKIDVDKYKKIRKQIKAKMFKSKAHMKEIYSVSQNPEGDLK